MSKNQNWYKLAIWHYVHTMSTYYLDGKLTKLWQNVTDFKNRIQLKCFHILSVDRYLANINILTCMYETDFLWNKRASSEY